MASWCTPLAWKIGARCAARVLTMSVLPCWRKTTAVSRVTSAASNQMPEGDVFMSRIDVRRIVAVLLLVFTLVPAFSWAAERRSEARGEGAIFRQVRLLHGFWSLLRSVWEEEGGSLDPDGQPRPNEGSSLDPSGSTGDEGSDLDPDGSTTDEGSDLDPNG